MAEIAYEVKKTGTKPNIYTLYEASSTASLDTITMNISGIKTISIQAAGISADTLVVSLTNEVGTPTSWIAVLNSSAANPFDAPTADVRQDIEVTTASQMKIARTGVADGTIKILISVIE